MKLAIVIAAGAAMLGSSYAETVRLAEKGRAMAKIVVAGDADKAARFAAADLKWHLDRITGGDFQIVAERDGQDARCPGEVDILVGAGGHAGLAREDFKPQEFTVKAQPGRIVLAGRDKVDKGEFTLQIAADGVTLKNPPGFYDEQGTMYAVYDFLERECGVIWADSTDVGTVLPKDPDLTVKVEGRTKEPYFSYRGGTITEDYEPLFWHWRSKEAAHFRAWAYANAKREKDATYLFRLRHRIGGINAHANHSFYDYYKLYWDEGDKKFVRKWPEIFAKGYDGRPPQMCYSSKEFIDLVIRDARAYFDQDPEKGKFKWGKECYSLEPMDNGFYCKCPDCVRQYEPERRKESAENSTYWFRFVKTVADELAKTHPSKRLLTLAYNSHNGLPNGVVLPKNVVVFFALGANREPYRELLQRELDRMKAWRDAYPGQPIAMWLYNTFPCEKTHNSGFHAFPGFFADEAYRQFTFFRENDIRFGILHCGFNGCVDNYMHLEWMIDPTRRPEEMLDEYFRGFGKAAAPLKEYYRTVERRYCDKSRYPKGAMGQTAKLAWGGDDIAGVMAKLERLIGEAEAAAGTPEEKKRVAQWKFETWQYMKEGYDTYVERQKAPKPDWTAVRVPSAGGDVAKVDWPKAAPVPFRLCRASEATPTRLAGSSRCAHDGAWFYLELTLELDTSKCKIAPGIFPCDTWELFLARDEALPYRHYASNPAGKMTASSNGEVNWRRNVPASESGDPTFGARATGDITAKDKWVQRFAFPLDRMLDKPLAAGDSFHLNCMTVLGKGHVPERRGHVFIYGVTPVTTVHDVDRMGSVRLEK